MGGPSTTTILTLNYYLRRFLDSFGELDNMQVETAEAVTFEKATEIRQVDSHTYEVNLQDDWCIGKGESRVSPVSKYQLSKDNVGMI